MGKAAKNFFKELKWDSTFPIIHPMSDAEDYYQNEAMRILQDAYEKQMEGSIEEAIDLYKKSIEMHSSAEGHTFLGWAYSAQKRYDDAIAECHKAIEVDPDYGNPYNDIGAYLIEKGRYDEALPWLEKAIHAKRYDSYCFAHYNLGRVWEKKGDWAKALACYGNAVRENPQYSLAQKAMNRLSAFLN